MHNLIFDNKKETTSNQFLKVRKSSSEFTTINNGRHFSLDISPLINSKYLDYVAIDVGAATAEDDNCTDINKREGTTFITNDKARYNLTTRIMSNGVEVIIAGVKNGKVSAKPNVLRIPPTLLRMPMTLAASTLENQMILVMPSNSQETYTISIDSKNFITKTCLTTYTYRTTYLQDDKTTVESREKVVSNTATEERNYLKIKPTETLGITLSRTPELAVGVFHTTYTYYNTILDGEHSIVVSSQHILRNTITGPDDYILFLQPSGEPTPVFVTNTYFSKISITKTLKESNLEKIVSTSKILTQVIVTESMHPPQGSSIITSNFAFNIDKTTPKDSSVTIRSPLEINNKLIESYAYYTFGEKLKILKPEAQNDKISELEKVKISSMFVPSTSMSLELLGSIQTDLHIYATKTYLTTFTYFTTLINTNIAGNIDSSTVVNFNTRVIENVITQSIPSFIINTEILSAFQTQLKNPQNHNRFATMVTLAGGQSLEITAMNIIHPLLSYRRNQATKIDTNTTKVESSLVSSDTQMSFENSNEIFDSNVSSSENEELLADQYFEAADVNTGSIIQNKTKIPNVPDDFQSVNQLLGSFNIHRLQALGPVFNAMAGLIPNNLNNFGNNLNLNYKLKENESILFLKGKKVDKNISTYFDNSTSVEHLYGRPMYIPVKISPYNNSYMNPEKIKSSLYQSLHILPPKSNSWFENRLNHIKLDISAGSSLSIVKPNYEIPLLNSGIPISPGEVITANSDVIVGKPNGIKPRVPYSNNIVHPLTSRPSILPVTPFQFKYEKVKANPILKPLPEYSQNLYEVLTPPSIKPHLMIQQHQQKQILPPYNSKNSNYRTNYVTSHIHHPLQHYEQQPQQKLIQMLNPPHSYQAQWLLKGQRLKPIPNYIPYTPNDNYQPPMSSRDKINYLHTPNSSNVINNEVLEIKRIPEVFSVDLPASESKFTNNNKNPTEVYKAVVKSIITTAKPLLVDVQPSKITSIIISSDNLPSYLVDKSLVQSHKDVQYFDDPTTSSDGFMKAGVALVSSLLSSANQPRKPISSNQQINLDMNVLSHNIDINVPPLTFKKDIEFPHSIPVRGHFQKNEVFTQFKMPHVTIPLSDNQVQVNLTPQNFIGKNLSTTQFVNKVKSSVKNEANVDNMKIGMEEPTTKTESMYYNKSNLKLIENNSYNHIINFKKESNSSNDHLYANIIPLRNNIESLNSSKKFTVRPIHFLKPIKYQNETLQIFARATPTSIQQSKYTLDKEKNYPTRRQPTKPSNHKAQVTISYNFSNDDSKYFINRDYFSENLSQSESNHNNHNFPKWEDQKPASSLNIVVPASKREQAINSSNVDSDYDDSVLESQIKKTPSNATNSISKLKPQLKKQNHLTITLPPIPEQSALSAINDLQINQNQFPESANANFTALYTHLSPGTQVTSKISSISTPSRENINISKGVLKSGEGFKLQSSQYHTHNSQVILPTSRINNDTKRKHQQHKNTNSSYQTESLFKPKYTQIYSIAPITDISINSATTFNSPLTQLLNLNQMEIFSNPSGIESNQNISYYNHKESTEIFDFHESINPHNYKFIDIGEGSLTLKQKKEQHRVYSSTDPMMIYHQIPTLKNIKSSYYVPEPSMDVKPSSLKTLSIKPQTEKLMGLNLPALSTDSSKTSGSIKTTPLRPPASSNNLNNYLNMKANQNPTMVPQIHMTMKITETTNATTKNPLTKEIRPANASTFAKYNPNISRPLTAPKSNPKIIFETAITTKPTKTTFFNRMSSLSLQPIIPDSRAKTFIPIISSGSYPTTNSSLFSSFHSSYSVSIVTSTTVKKLDAKNDAVMILLNQETPDQILIEGSENLQHIQPTSLLENQLKSTLMSSSGESIVVAKNQTSNSVHGSNFNNYSTQEARIQNPAIVVNKFITKSYYITVTSTKLSVAKSLGVPFTQTLTLTLTETKTSTVIETHTLLHPTRVAESYTTTTEQIRQYESHHQHHQQYRTGSKIKPTIEVVNNVLLPNNELYGSGMGLSVVPTVIAPTTASILTRIVEEIPSTNSDLKKQELEDNSIFVVMTDKNNQGISPSMNDIAENNGRERVEVLGIPKSPNSIELDYDYNITFDYLPTRDEEGEANKFNHVLLGGVLIATPPNSSKSIAELTPSTYCRPSCKASRNELCQKIDNQMECLCRPGFARIFPDRPCRPTYTYALEILIHRINTQVLHFNEEYRIRDSDYFKQLADITRNAVDRMVMQSDLRDMYHGVHVTSFDVHNSPEVQGGILGTFLIQLSDNSDEKRLLDVFKKYLRQHNFSLGGTDIFTTKDGINSLKVNDFNECAHSQFHDCSINAKCFNLQGTYTCSCQEGFVDLSENTIYPGRICSIEVIGCEKCHFHGQCVQTNNTKQSVGMICECFSWYSGAWCQLNMKIFVILLITIGTILFIILLSCVLVTCIRRRDSHNMSVMQKICPKNANSSTKNLAIDKRAIIKDSSSEGSQNSLLYILKRDVKKNYNHHTHTKHYYQHQNKNQRGHPPSGIYIPSFSEMDHQCNNFPEQNDRSLTVMIPRAKYQHYVLGRTCNHASDGLDLTAQANEAQSKIVLLDTSGSISNSSTFQCSNDNMVTNNKASYCAGISSGIVTGSVINQGTNPMKSTGALISAGYEVSSTVGNIVNYQRQQSLGCSTANLLSHDNTKHNFDKCNYNNATLKYNNYKNGEKLIDSMDERTDTIQQKKLASEARRFEETSIHAPSNSLSCIYQRRLSQSNGHDEANTMAEREIGSTCLLPHTHLYKPERESDVSGFDSF